MSKTTILIVEDEAIVAADLEGKLRRLGYDVVGIASEGQEAVTMAKRLRPQLVLMDIRLEGSMDGVIGAVLVFHDVTEKHRAEDALRRAKDELELRVRERTAELERKNQELQEFAFVASHDLGEPLRKIQTFGSLLEAKSAERLGEEEIDCISRMTGAANRMQELR